MLSVYQEAVPAPVSDALSRASTAGSARATVGHSAASATHPNLETLRGPFTSEFGGHALEDLGCEMPYLRGPGRMIGAHDEGTGHQANGADVGGHRRPHQL